MFLLIATTLMVSALTAFWLMLTQPLLFSLSEPVTALVTTPENLEKHVRMLSETLAPRDYLHTENLDRAAQYIRREFEQVSAAVTEQPFTANGRTYRNVIAAFGPEGGERIVIGAHYDVCQPYPGADDNASGVAGLIELAKLLRQSSLPLRVELVAYTLEEPPYFRTGLMGSAIHAQSLRQHNVSVRAMLSLEMIGYFSDEPGSQSFPSPVLRLFYPSEGNFITVTGDFGQLSLTRKIKAQMRHHGGLPVHSINAPQWIPGVDFSDHLNYWQAGYPAVMITDTAFYRNKNYHTPQDTADRLDYRRMAMVVKGVHAAILALAQTQ